MEYNDYFYWACVVLDSIGWPSQRITDLLITKKFNCCKATVCRAVDNTYISKEKNTVRFTFLLSRYI